MDGSDRRNGQELSAAAPQYLSIAADLRGHILRGEWSEGTRLPSEHALAERYGVSRMTLRGAVTQLVHQGLLQRHQGRGTFVTAHKVVRGLSSVRGLREDLVREGLAPGSRTLSVARRAATTAERTQLDLPRRQEVWELVRVRTADQVTIALQDVVIPTRILADLDRLDLEQHSLYSILGERGFGLVRARQRIEAVVDPLIAARLQLDPATAFLKVTRLSYAEADQPVELLVSHFVGNTYAYDTELS